MSVQMNPNQPTSSKRGEDVNAEQIDNLFKSALNQANGLLAKEGVNVFFEQHVPKDPIPKWIDHKRNLLLGISQGTHKEPIDIIDMKEIDETLLKSADTLAKEIVLKVKQHLAAKKTQGILISSSGSKFDIRKLTKHQVAIDTQGYLRIDDTRLAYPTQKGNWILKAENLRSYTIIRVIEEKEGIIRLFDDYDLKRANNLGMITNLSKIITLATKELLEESQGDANDYNGKYFIVERDTLTWETKQGLLDMLNTFASP